MASKDCIGSGTAESRLRFWHLQRERASRCQQAGREPASGAGHGRCRQRHQLLDALFDTARLQVAAVEKLGLYYNPADVLWGPISEFRSNLLVYRKAGSLQYSPTTPSTVHGSIPPLVRGSRRPLLVSGTGQIQGLDGPGAEWSELGWPAPRCKASFVDRRPGIPVLGVGPFEWRWQAIQRGLAWT